MERKRKLTVEITGAKNDSLWYRDKVGKQFEVKSHQNKDYYEIPLGEGRSRIIYKEDCKEV